ncbi:MAG: hypothetical protein OZSIB_3532 [Candidatus Ozemobacter sibiricus]|uniref:Uncharacterized protein n=1 Tax=Candidatus Ozemobacter sibiricus TaxID=2268124 RepID=A0A367ZPH1_9BACT|nr:MAG: hypothetical protein OZSIB_3532 [Candidatus Ozemobacter sibiricus]
MAISGEHLHIVESQQFTHSLSFAPNLRRGIGRTPPIREAQVGPPRPFHERCFALTEPSSPAATGCDH